MRDWVIWGNGRRRGHSSCGVASWGGEMGDPERRCQWATRRILMG